MEQVKSVLDHIRSNTLEHLKTIKELHETTDLPVEIVSEIYWDNVNRHTANPDNGIADLKEILFMFLESQGINLNKFSKVPDLELTVNVEPFESLPIKKGDSVLLKAKGVLFWVVISESVNINGESYFGVIKDVTDMILSDMKEGTVCSFSIEHVFDYDPLIEN